MNFRVLSLILLVTAVTSWEFEEDVLVLEDDNYKEAIKTYEFLLVKFYAPWCGHCKQFAPELSKAGAMLKEHDYVVAKLDCVKNGQAAREFGVSSYPTVKFFYKGKQKDFDGERTAEGVYNWYLEAVLPSFTEIKSQQELKELLTPNNAIFGYFGDNDSELDQFDIVSDKLRKQCTFIHSKVLKEIYEKYGLFVDGKVIPYTGLLAPKFVEYFLYENSYPFIFNFNQRELDFVFKQNNPAILLTGRNQELENNFRQLANEYKNLLKFAIVHENQPYLKELDLEFPALYLYDTRVGFQMNYQHDGALSFQEIQEFLAKWKRKELEPVMKSEPLPEVNNGPVKIIVGKNYQKEVVNNDKDVLLEFYAPWCGHCKKLAPTYDELGEYMKRNPKILIAKVDATANEIPGFDVHGFPTIKFIKKRNGNMEVMEYSGGRTLEEFIKFLQNATSHPWVNEDL